MSPSWREDLVVGRNTYDVVVLATTLARTTGPEVNKILGSIRPTNIILISMYA